MRTLSDDERAAIDREVAHLPSRRAGALEALKAVQSRRGWISDEAVEAIAEHLGLTPAELDGVATFYNLVFRQPVGRHVILICDSVSCWVMGQEELHERARRLLGIDEGETSADGRFTLLSTACLGACDRAPALMIDDDLHGPITAEELPALLDRYRRKKRA